MLRKRTGRFIDIARSYFLLLQKKTKFSIPFFVKVKSLNVEPGVRIGKSGTIDAETLTLCEKTSIFSECMISGKNISIGRGTSIHEKCRFTMGPTNLEIGSFSAISNHVSIWGVDHDYSLPAIQARFFQHALETRYPYITKGDVFIGNDVLIGQNTIVMPGVQIGDGAIVGAGTIVTKDVPPYAVAVGVPNTIKRYRFEKDVIDFLLDLRWWNWGWDKLARNRAFFQTNLNEQESVAALRKLII